MEDYAPICCVCFKVKDKSWVRLTTHTAGKNRSFKGTFRYAVSCCPSCQAHLQQAWSLFKDDRRPMVPTLGTRPQEPVVTSSRKAFQTVHEQAEPGLA